MNHSGKSILELFDEGLTAEQISEGTGYPIERVRNQLNYMGADGTDCRADVHQRRIREGTQALLKRLVAVAGPMPHLQAPRS